MKPWAEAELIACHKAIFLSCLNSLQFSYSYCLFKADCGIISMSNSWPLYPLQAVHCSQLIAEIHDWSVLFACSYRSLVLLQRRNCFTVGHVPGLPAAVSPRWPGTSARRPGQWDGSLAAQVPAQPLRMWDGVFLGVFSSCSELTLWMSCPVSQCALGSKEKSEHQRSLCWRAAEDTGCQQDPKSQQSPVSLRRLRQHRAGSDEDPN